MSKMATLEDEFLNMINGNEGFRRSFIQLSELDHDSIQFTIGKLVRRRDCTNVTKQRVEFILTNFSVVIFIGGFHTRSDVARKHGLSKTKTKRETKSKCENDNDRTLSKIPYSLLLTILVQNHL